MTGSRASMFLAGLLVAGCATVDSDRPEVRARAMAKVTRSADLYQLALQSRYEDIRLAAARGLSDQTLLTGLAMHAPHGEVRTHSVASLYDQSILAGIAMESDFTDTRCEAVRRVVDQSLLHRLADAPDAGVRSIAIVQLDDQELLKDVALKSNWSECRLEALRRVRDDRVLRQIVLVDAVVENRCEAARRIGSQEILGELLVAIGEPQILAVVLPLLVDESVADRPEVQAALGRIVREVVVPSTRARALMKINDRGVLREPRIQMQMASDAAGWEESAQLAALERIVDPDALVFLAINTGVDSVAQSIVDKLSGGPEDVLLQTIAREANRLFVRYYAVNKLVDDRALEELRDDKTNPRMANAAGARLDQLNRQEVKQTSPWVRLPGMEQ